MAIIPNDLVEDILTRLPVNHLLRCKLLSKTYYALINNPRFINKHFVFHRSNKNLLTLMIKEVEEEEVVDGMLSLLPNQSDIYVPPLLDNRKLCMAGSCNGLQCALLVVRESTLLWNPATRDHVMLPPFNFDDYRAIGFGYDAGRDDYKLIKISYDRDIRIQVESWSMRSNSWKEVEIGSRASRLNQSYWYFTELSGVFLRGKFYWFAHNPVRYGDQIYLGFLAIVSFDLVDENFQVQILDDVVEKDRFALRGFGMNVFDFKGSLALSVPKCRYNNDTVEWTIEIWVMAGDDKGNKMEESTWTKQFSDVGPFLLYPYSSLRVIYFDDKLVVKENAIAPILLYDIRTKERKQLSCDGEPIYRHTVPWCYSESLVSLNHLKATRCGVDDQQENNMLNPSDC